MDSRKWKRNIAIMVLGAFNAESLSTSTPPYQWVLGAPLTILVTFMFYGLMLLVIEDLVSRYSLDYRKLFLIGLIYGILEEGFLALTNELPDQGFVGFGRYYGLNVPWAILTSEIHAIYTVVLTFIIVDLIVPREKSGPVLSKWQYVPVLSYLAILYLFVPNYLIEIASTRNIFAVLLSKPEFFLSNFFLIRSIMIYPSWESVVIQLVVILVLSVLVMRLPRLNLDSSEKEVVSGKSYAILLLLFGAMFWIPYLLQFFGGPDVLVVIYYLLLPPVFWRLILSKIRKDSLFDLKKVATMSLTLLLFFGGTGVFIYLMQRDLLSVIMVIAALGIEAKLIARKYFQRVKGEKSNP
jgi:hypothetical protein